MKRRGESQCGLASSVSCSAVPAAFPDVPPRIPESMKIPSRDPAGTAGVHRLFACALRGRSGEIQGLAAARLRAYYSKRVSALE